MRPERLSERLSGESSFGEIPPKTRSAIYRGKASWTAEAIADATPETGKLGTGYAHASHSVGHAVGPGIFRPFGRDDRQDFADDRSCPGAGASETRLIVPSQVSRSRPNTADDRS